MKKYYEHSEYDEEYGKSKYVKRGTIYHDENPYSKYIRKYRDEEDDE